jgi:hypothetical protein
LPTTPTHIVRQDQAVFDPINKESGDTSSEIISIQDELYDIYSAVHQDASGFHDTSSDEQIELKLEQDSVRGARFLQAPVNCTTSNDCDDGNVLTISTCNVEGKCEYECNDNNACTREDIVDGVCQYLDDCEVDEDCVPGLIECDDDNLRTVDFCLSTPQASFVGGCNHIDGK